MTLREQYRHEENISRGDVVQKPLIEMTGYIKWLESKLTISQQSSLCSTDTSPKSCATCKNENETYGKCFYCCRKCFSDWEERT